MTDLQAGWGKQFDGANGMRGRSQADAITSRFCRHRASTDLGVVSGATRTLPGTAHRAQGEGAEACAHVCMCTAMLCTTTTTQQ